MYHQPKVSVIIPCFQSENYLQKAVDSVINQSLHALEIILVDDGSTDKTPVLLQQYKMQDNRVEVITHKKNLGLGAARNSGMQKATGKYIFFLDSDDYIHLNSLEVLVEQAEREQTDILQARHVAHKSGKKEILPKTLISFPQAITGKAYYRQGFFIEPKACAKLWRNDFIKKHQLTFAEGYYEDMAMVMEAVALTERINNILFPAYHYIIRPASITGQKITEKHIEGYQNSLIQMQSLFLHPDLVQKESVFPAQYFLYLKNLSLMALQTEDKNIQTEVKHFVEEMARKYGQFLKGNKNLSIAKRVLLQKSPYVYAQLKRKWK